MKLDFEKEEVQWIDKVVPFHPVSWYSNKEAVRQVLSVPPVYVRRAEARDSLVNEIKAAIYGKADLEAVANSQTHLTLEQRKDLLGVFCKHKALFSGKVGKFPREFHLHMEPSVETYCQMRPYPLNSQHLQVLKEELDRQEKLGIISKCNEATDWCMPMFVRPKKDGTIRMVHDFRMLNRAIKCMKHTLPRIEDMLHKTQNYWYLTKIDMSMQYYTFYLDAESRYYCVFITPFGKYFLNTLAMGCVQSGDYAQAAMEETLRDILDRVMVYMDDIKYEDLTWEKHLQMTDKVLTRLENMQFTVNPAKCEWGVEETDFLGYKLTPSGAKPWPKRIEPIIALEEPRTLRELRHFIGMVNFYRPMFEKHAHILTPLMGLTKVSPQAFRKMWKEEHSKAFEEVKAMVSREVLLAYLDLNAEFLIEADASNYQLGAVIKQHGKPIAFYSRKLTTTQRKYSTIKKELLSILEVLEEYRSLLWGRDIWIRCDHKNISFDNMKSNRVKNWRLLIEDFKPTIEYYPGEKNIEADALSWMPTKRDKMDAEQVLLEVMLNYPNGINQFPGRFRAIYDSQQANQYVLNLLDQEDYELHNHRGYDLVCCRDVHGEWKIVLTGALINDVIEWYHMILSHAGAT